MPIIRSWTGVDGDTSDGVCIVGESETHPGLIHAFGFNGHGFLLGPGVGATVTELILDGRTETEIGGLGIGRFRKARERTNMQSQEALLPSRERDAQA